MVSIRQHKDFVILCKTIQIDEKLAELFYNEHIRNIQKTYNEIYTSDKLIIKNFIPHFTKTIIICNEKIIKYDIITYYKFLMVIFQIKLIHNTQIFITQSQFYVLNTPNLGFYEIYNLSLNSNKRILQCDVNSDILMLLQLILTYKNCKTYFKILFNAKLHEEYYVIMVFFKKYYNNDFCDLILSLLNKKTKHRKIITNKINLQEEIKQYFLIRNNLMVIMEQSAISPIKNNKHNHSYWYCLEDYVFSSEYIMSKIMKYV